ncbi:Inosine-5'-monophosphate dehydrogenase [Neomoorella glycerini]|uniref:Inosine-5'-monophosphate dehydrogenase n=1 Tax=Neomoorella glycerini TaxID=55779 RepID=A0A6I5ZU89_9FIRM|nr:CBS domain-containing protein [Moorella glycerini]QGP93500.1 Inosine-5'-monophosphate dehydrogenase [Moorella glycerini]
MILARDIMTTDVVVVHPDDRVGDVVQLFVQEGVTSAVVIDKEGKIKGIITDGDIMAAVRQRRPVFVDLFNSLFVLEDNNDLTTKVQFLTPRPVKDIMTRRVIAVGEDASIAEIAGLMTDHKIKQVPVVREGQLIGLVRRHDIVQAVARNAT